jgi:hypothetical protein
MRTLTFFTLLSLLAACQRSVEVSGLYANAPTTYAEAPPPLVRSTGQFFPCAQPGSVWWISDSALAKRYQAAATHPQELLFARLRGVRADSGSVYWSAHHLVVQEVLELRGRRPGECPGAPDTLSQALGR